MVRSTRKYQRRGKSASRSRLSRHLSRRFHKRMRGGKNALGPIGSALDLTNDLGQSLVDTLSNIVGGLVDGANVIVNTTGEAVEEAGDMFDVVATQIFTGAGNIAKQCADGLGAVLRVIPLVGGGIAYVVESGGGGIYHVVVALGKFTGSAVKRTGKVAKKGTDLIVYTLTEGKCTIKDTGRTVNSLVNRLKVN